MLFLLKTKISLRHTCHEFAEQKLWQADCIGTFSWERTYNWILRWFSSPVRDIHVHCCLLSVYSRSLVALHHIYMFNQSLRIQNNLYSYLWIRTECQFNICAHNSQRRLYWRKLNLENDFWKGISRNGSCAANWRMKYNFLSTFLNDQFLVMSMLCFNFMNILSAPADFLFKNLSLSNIFEFFTRKFDNSKISIKFYDGRYGHSIHVCLLASKVLKNSKIMPTADCSISLRCEDSPSLLPPW